MRAEIDDPDTIVLKATLGHRIVGSVRCRIGATLLTVIEELASPSVERFELHTGAKSEANIAIYERRGYRQFHRDVGPTLTVLSLEKPARGGR